MNKDFIVISGITSPICLIHLIQTLKNSNLSCIFATKTKNSILNYMDTHSPYGFETKPFYSLYCNNHDKYGLIYKSGNKLPAVLDRIDERSFLGSSWG